MDGSSRALGGVTPVASIQKGWNAYLLLVVIRPVTVVPSSVNDWTIRSVAYSLQNGRLASICTSYDEDSERNIQGFMEAYCGNGVSVCHVSWFCEARVVDRSDLQDPPHLPSLAIRNGKIIWVHRNASCVTQQLQCHRSGFPPN